MPWSIISSVSSDSDGAVRWVNKNGSFFLFSIFSRFLRLVIGQAALDKGLEDCHLRDKV